MQLTLAFQKQAFQNQGYGSVFRKLNGTNGAITRAFASVMRSLWHNECSSAVIQSFRSTLGRYNAAYRSFIQQVKVARIFSG